MKKKQEGWRLERRRISLTKQRDKWQEQMRRGGENVTTMTPQRRGWSKLNGYCRFLLHRADNQQWVRLRKKEKEMTETFLEQKTDGLSCFVSFSLKLALNLSSQTCNFLFNSSFFGFFLSVVVLFLNSHSVFLMLIFLSFFFTASSLSFSLVFLKYFLLYLNLSLSTIVQLCSTCEPSRIRLTLVQDQGTETLSCLGGKKAELPPDFAFFSQTFSNIFWQFTPVRFQWMTGGFFVVLFSVFTTMTKLWGDLSRFRDFMKLPSCQFLFYCIIDH